jgi:hypothetical protein
MEVAQGGLEGRVDGEKVGDTTCVETRCGRMGGKCERK